jgi:hypothetical protein
MRAGLAALREAFSANLAVALARSSALHTTPRMPPSAPRTDLKARRSGPALMPVRGVCVCVCVRACVCVRVCLHVPGC